MHTIAFATRDKTKYDDYNKVKNFLKSSLRNVEILYYSNQFELHNNDLTKSWKLLKTIIGKDLKSSLNTTFTINNRIVTDSREIAYAFDNYSISIGPLLASDITCIDNSIVIVNMSYSEVERVISSQKNSSAGWDEIPTFVAKIVFIVILNH